MTNPVNISIGFQAFENTVKVYASLHHADSGMFGQGASSSMSRYMGLDEARELLESLAGEIASAERRAAKIARCIFSSDDGTCVTSTLSPLARSRTMWLAARRPL